MLCVSKPQAQCAKLLASGCKPASCILHRNLASSSKRQASGIRPKLESQSAPGPHRFQAPNSRRQAPGKPRRLAFGSGLQALAQTVPLLPHAQASISELQALSVSPLGIRFNARNIAMPGQPHLRAPSPRLHAKDVLLGTATSNP